MGTRLLSFSAMLWSCGGKKEEGGGGKAGEHPDTSVTPPVRLTGGKPAPPALATLPNSGDSWLAAESGRPQCPQAGGTQGTGGLYPPEPGGGPQGCSPHPGAGGVPVRGLRSGSRAQTQRFPLFYKKQEAQPEAFPQPDELQIIKAQLKSSRTPHPEGLGASPGGRGFNY